MNLEQRIELIKHNLERGGYTIVAKECVGIIELAFRELLRRNLTQLSEHDRLKIHKAELEIGKGEKGIESFTMGQLVGVLRTSRFLEAWARATGRELTSIRVINLDELTTLRNRLIHEGREASRAEAEFLFNCLQVILETFGIVSLEEVEGPGASKIEQDPVLSNSSSERSKVGPLQQSDKSGLPLSKRLRFNLQRKKVYWIGAGIITIFILTLLGLVKFYIWKGEAEKKPDTAMESGKENILDSKYRIAVLPLANYSPAPEDEYFADGMTEELISTLSKISGLRVVARTSIMKYKGVAKDVTDIGRELNVGTILEGSVRKVEDKVRVTIQLIDIQSQRHLWSQDYDRELKDLFAIQSDIAENVAEALKVQLMAEEKRQIEKKGTENLEAYTLYLKGRYQWNEYTGEGLKKSIEYFEGSIKKDPNYAQAYVGLSDASSMLGFYNVELPKALISRARTAATKALEIDATLAETHTSLGLVKLVYDWDWPGAENAFKQALARNSDYAPAHQWYAWCLSVTGRHDEALAEIQKAVALDPFSLIINRDVGLTFYFARQYDQAIEQYQKTLEMDPNFRVTYWGLGLVYLQKKRYEDAVSTLQKSKSPGVLGYAYAMSGKKDEAQGLLNQLREQSRQRYIQSYFLAIIYFGLGEKDQAFEWFQKAYEERSPYLIWLQVDPLYDSLRSDPRFVELLKKMGLEK